MNKNKSRKTSTDEIEGEAALGDEFLPLVEKAVRKDGTIPIKIIQPGWGSSGYYAPEVLERDGPQVFQSGLHMYWNHPSLTEEMDRPERSLSDLAAVLVSDAHWKPDGPSGPGLYADAKVFSPYQQSVDELAEHIGVSIRAMGKAEDGEAEGREGPIITELTAGKSIDFVTAPGAGGEILTLFEAARTVRADKSAAAGPDPDVAISESQQEDDMELKELQEAVATLQTGNEKLTAENARLTEALALRDARDFVREALGGIQLPEATRKRLVTSLPKQAVIKEGKLDEDAFGKLVQEAVKAEMKYLTEAAGLGKIKGLGGSDEEADEKPEEVQESLKDSFTALGLSEKAAEIAAKGRS